MAPEHDINEKLYEMVCKDRFDSLDSGQKDIMSLLRGKNGNPGLVDDVRGLKKFNKYAVGAVAFLVCTGIAQFIHWLFAGI